VSPPGRLRVAQIGSRHGHAAGKWRALIEHPEVEALGIFEPDPARRGRDGFAGARWFDSQQEALDGAEAVAIEGRNYESLAMAQAAIEAGTHLWFDKPAGDDWGGFTNLMDAAERRGLYVQMGYMFRYSPGFLRVAELARSGQLGRIFAIRAHMSTNVDLAERTEQSRHRGGILYDLGGHMLDQIVWLLGRPQRVSAVLRNDATPELPTYTDNSLAIFEFEHALASLEIAAMEAAPTARRFEVYGTAGSAILQPFDPARDLRLVTGGTGERQETLPELSRQGLYDRELEAFVGVVRGRRPPDRPPEHERLVQETVLRATGSILGA
jgi:predicted dehydrogenase